MSRKIILLVEDDIDIRENMVMILEDEGYQVYETQDGAEAMIILENNKLEAPDVIILDLFMPVMNGREFLEVISKHTNEKLGKIPVILVTASEQNMRQDLEERTAAVLRKPIQIEDLFDILKSIVN